MHFPTLMAFVEGLKQSCLVFNNQNEITVVNYGLTTLFDTIYGLIVLFQLTFTYIYSTFTNKFSISTK